MKIKRLLVVSLMFVPCYCLPQTSSRNYVKTVTMFKAGGSDSDSAQAVQYYDGLGYPVASVATANTNGGTAYTLTTYDAQGRVFRKYVPVPGSGLSYMNESSVSSLQYPFYSDNSGFEQYHYDGLNRATATDIAGDRWRQAGKQNRTAYLANTDNDMVLHYEAPEDGTYRLIEPEDASFGHYPEGTLSKVVSYDADDKCVTVFTDLFGKKILERTDAGDTYYVYNALGQLRFVLTPGYNKKSRSKTIFAYEYRYDDRGRMFMKILPKDSSSGSVTHYCYDRADRMAYMKDPALGSRYRFYLYDKYGRLCVQGTCSSGQQDSAILATTTYGGNTGGICNTGYTVPYTINDPQLEIVNYYDDYDSISTYMKGKMPSVVVDDNQQEYSMGFLIGQVVSASNGTTLGSINVYDQKGQVVRTVRKGLDGLLEDVSTAYSLAGAVDCAEANVNVKYGSKFTAKTEYTYKYGKKTKMKLSVSHGRTTPPRETEYTYDAVGRLSSKKRQMTGNAHSACSYRYDVHGWLTSITSGEFQEKLYYADGLDGGCYNGNISTIKWKADNDNFYQGYNLKYDANNRLYNAVFGADDNLTSYKNNFNEYAEYDCNGNITRLQRRGLVNNMHGAFGLVDDLYMSYEGNLLTSVRDNSTHSTYAGATDFYTDSSKKEYPLTYNGAGSLVSDAGRKIAKIDYDLNNNPVRIQFTNGNVTKYIYSAMGEKLRVTYQTAVPNISVAIGKTKELAPSEILSTDYTDYLLGGSLTLKNGRIDKYQFDEGYCQAEKYIYNTSQDEFTFCYYDKDHLGNIHQVTEPDGTKTGNVIQKINYYPFGAQFCDGSTDSNVQSHKYNGKEFDKMHGLNTYDYGARQYNPITARWDRMDPLAEKYYSISPYVYCMNNPIIHVDPDGKEKKSYLSKEETQNSDYNLYPENTPGVLNIWAHGTKELKTDKYSWSIKVDRHYIDNATDLRRFVLCHCKEWINNQGRNIIIVLHACSSSNLAKIMSAQDIFKGKNITIIAPNAKLKKNRVGSVVNSKTYFDSDTKKVVGKEEGQWRVYKDGELINTLPADAQPGLTNKKELDILIKDKK